MMKRIVIWFMVLAAGAMVLGDMLIMFADAAELPGPTPAVTAAADPGRIEVAQLFGRPQQDVQVQQRGGQPQPQQPKKRKSLFDFLFGGGDDEQDQAPVVQKPKPKPKVAVLPPAKPKVEKAEGATRLAVFGDSLAIDVGKALTRLYEDDPNMAVLEEGIGDSSIVRPDYFDWPKAIQGEIDKKSFDIAVVVLGVNDRQNIRVPNADSLKTLTPDWTTQYSARVAQIVAELKQAGRPTIWVGLPPMPPGSLADAMIQINEIQRLAVFGGGAEFVDIYDRFLGDDGAYASTGPDLNGNPVKIRAGDGIHFTSAGADKLAFYLSQSIKAYYRGGGTVGIEVADPLQDTDAQFMLRPPYQGLGQMKLLEVAGAVIPLNHAQKRAADLVTASNADVATGFDMTQLIDAPVGRADAFGVGKEPVPDKADDEAAAAQPGPSELPTEAPWLARPVAAAPAATPAALGPVAQASEAAPTP